MVQLQPVRDPAAPFVTYYNGSSGERTELSMTSFNNWAAKTANYLCDEFDLEPASVIELALPMHWTVPIWVAAARSVGASVRVRDVGADGSGPADLTVVGSTDTHLESAAGAVVACSMLPLAAPFRSPLPEGVQDYFAEVRSFGDHFAGPSIDRDTPALWLANRQLTVAELREFVVALAAEHHVASGDRILVTDRPVGRQDGVSVSMSQLLMSFDIPMAIGGSSVIVAELEATRIEHIASQERVTATIENLDL